jgi:hypothetical protein
MHALRVITDVTFAIALAAPHGAAGSPTLGLDDRPSDRDVITFGIRAEGSFRTWLGDQFPVVEGYFQGFDPAPKVGFALKDDHYVLGRYSGGKMENLLAFPMVNGEANPEENVAEQRLLDGLQRMMVADWSDLSPEHYDYQFVGQALLGAVPCLVYDVKPRSPEAGIFEGRIYLERRMWNLVRFTGFNMRVDELLSTLRDKRSRIRIDSWRINVSENRWAPAFAYVEEAPPLGAPDAHIVKGQVRFWGYGKATEQRQQELATLKLWESASTVASGGQRGCSPQECQRLFENQAEANVLARLFQARLLGVTGEVEHKLDQVMTNLLISYQLALPQPVRCRVLLTTRLEAFMVGNTLILSRGLIDVLPEAGIAISDGTSIGAHRSRTRSH